MNLKDTVMASEEGKENTPEPEPSHPQNQASTEQGLHISPPQLVELAPRLKRYGTVGLIGLTRLIHGIAAIRQ